MIKKITAALSGLLLVAGTAMAQHEKCANTEIYENYLATHTAAKEAFEKYEADIQARTAEIARRAAVSGSKTTAGPIQIPVVMHVVLSQAQIDEIGGVAGVLTRAESQIKVLNTDFNSTNSDTADIPAVFKPLKGSANFNFALVHTDPNGHATSGVDIKVMPVSFTGFQGQDAAVKSSLAGGIDPWDNKRYLNVWITNITTSSGGEILGYAYSPKYANDVFQNSDLMGVVVDYLAFGKRQSITDQYFSNADRGRTMVHEMGHFFTLFHIWGNTAVGSGTCGDDDGVDDTPLQKDANQSKCPTTVIANCNNTPGGEMYMNYMDYVFDYCMHLFTVKQVQRMQSEFSTSGGSYTLQWNGSLMGWPAGVSELEAKNNFDITPNPTNGLLNISLNTTAENLKSITVVNQLGQNVKQVNFNANSARSYSIDMTESAKGMYFVRCAFESGIVTKNIVLQ